MKKVTFRNNLNNYITCLSKYDYDRSLGSSYYRGLIDKNEKNEIKISDILNNNEFFKIIYNKKYQLKIINKKLEWSNDDSPNNFYKLLIENRNNEKEFIINLIYNYILNFNLKKKKKIYNSYIDFEIYTIIIDLILINNRNTIE